MHETTPHIVELIKRHGYRRLDTAVRLASGNMSYDYVDGKRAIAEGGDAYRVVCLAAITLAAEMGVDFTAVGGKTMGADPLAHGISLLAGCKWVSVRSQPKGRGLDKWIEGAQLTGDDSVLLVDDVVTTGGSVMDAYTHIRDESGARIAGVIAMVDRGDATRQLFERHGVPYGALVTYRDLGIEPVEPQPVP
jgi:orotate phosphoribosyltransferase